MPSDRVCAVQHSALRRRSSRRVRKAGDASRSAGRGRAPARSALPRSGRARGIEGEVDRRPRDRPLARRVHERLVGRLNADRAAGEHDLPGGPRTRIAAPGGSNGTFRPGPPGAHPAPHVGGTPIGRLEWAPRVCTVRGASAGTPPRRHPGHGAAPSPAVASTSTPESRPICRNAPPGGRAASDLRHRATFRAPAGGYALTAMCTGGPAAPITPPPTPARRASA